MPQEGARRAASSRWSRPRLFAVSGLVALAAIVAGSAGLAGEDRASDPPADDPTIVTRAPTTTTSTVAAPGTTTTLPALSRPQDPPVDPRADVPVVPIGEVEIPRIGLVHTIYEGVWLTVIDEGPGHWPGTPLPGGYGNVVLAGHRVTHSHPFRRIDELVEGDEILLRTDEGLFTYRVTGHEVVTPDAVRIVDQAPGYTLTLFACHPPGSAAYRYVVYAELVPPA